MRAAVLALVLGLTSTCAAADPVWFGGDDMGTSPLDCAGATPARDTMPYQGGRPLNPPDRRGKTLSVVDIPKLVGIPYFAATSKGIAEAARELGNVSVKTVGSGRPSSADQVDSIESAVARGVDGILFAADDPVAIAPALNSALAKGMNVIGYDADAEPDARQWFVDQAEPNGIAKALVDTMAAQIGEDGGFAIITSSATTPNQARWIAEMSAYAAKCHPKMRWLETIEAQEDNLLSFDGTTTLIGKYGEAIKGIFTMTSVATPAAAEAVTEAGDCGRIAVVGLGTPKAMTPYVAKGCVKSVILWNPVDLGYAALYVMRAAADGTLKPGDVVVKAGKLGDLRIINGSEVLLGAPFIFTRDNIGNFDF